MDVLKKRKKKERMTGFGVGRRYLRKKPSLSTYTKGARNKNREWRLTEDRFDELVSMSCHYCGAEPFMYNGIDRMDNEIGYIEGNVVPCCSSCNYFKRDILYEDFLNIVFSIARHRLFVESQ